LLEFEDEDLLFPLLTSTLLQHASDPKSPLRDDPILGIEEPGRIILGSDMPPNTSAELPLLAFDQV
jgi:hypothetical protein